VTYSSGGGETDSVFETDSVVETDSAVEDVFVFVVSFEATGGGVVVSSAGVVVAWLGEAPHPTRRLVPSTDPRRAPRTLAERRIAQPLPHAAMAL
jgi:hypothetical protein